ncbi:UNVERIFIED_CONTAM: hypothetical protein K2H54_053208 [Gekko kuhli]
MAGSSPLALLVTLSLQSLVTSTLGQDNSTAEPTSSSPPPYRISSSELAAAIAVPTVFCVVLLTGLLVFMGLRIREKRQTEGTYRPSSEEQVGARVATNANLKLPPEERLI